MSSLKTRVIVNNAVNYKGTAYTNEDLYGRNGERVLIEEAIDVMTEEKFLTIYSEEEESICEIALGKVNTIGELNEAM